MTAPRALPLPGGAGGPLAAALWTGRSRPRAGIVALHSYGDSRFAFRWLAPHLVQAGFAVLAYDIRGNGQRPAAQGWPGARVHVADADAAADALRRETGASRIVMLGESIGSAIALLYAARNSHKLDALILAPPAARRGHSRKALWDAAIFGLGRLAPWLPLPMRALSEAALDRRHRARRRADDRLPHATRAATYAQAVAMCDAADALAPAVKIPSLLISAADDELVAPESVRALAADFGGPVRRILVPGGPHLVLQARDAKRLWDIIAAFARDATAPHGPRPSPGKYRRRIIRPLTLHAPVGQGPSRPRLPRP